jgi:hypothetical protein
VVDVGDPESPAELSTAPTGGLALGVVARGSRAYVADLLTGVRVFDLSDPGSPVDLGGYDPGDGASDVAVDDRGLAHVAARLMGYRIVDLGDPSAPEPKGGFELPGPASAVSVLGERAYLALGDDDVLAVDTSDPMLPVVAATQLTSGEAVGLAVSGNLVYVADGSDGLYLLRDAGVGIQGPGPTPISRTGGLAPNRPNPFNPRTWIPFRLETSAVARLVVHDASGRRLRVLVDRRVEAGEHVAAWDGMDDAGRPCPSGVYLVRLEVAGAAAGLRRMVLIE